MRDDLREYRYRPGWTGIIVGIVFFSLFALLFGAKAAKNDRGLNINGIVNLEPEAVTTFYLTLAACFTFFVALGGALAYHRCAYRQRLAFGATALIVPVSRWSRKEKEIAYREIRELSQSTNNGYRFLRITHSEGIYTITASMLPTEAAFAELCEFLGAKVRESCSAGNM